MTYKGFTAFDGFRIAVAIGCVGYSFVFGVGILGFEDLTVKIALAGLAFTTMGLAVTLQSCLATEMAIRRLEKKD
ncbi:MAG: hypothetical protein M0Q92_02685 [Methanoregula sp.]|jgi:hypothetical protein|nr:hypothetical protein [Methanoregula sp.]